MRRVVLNRWYSPAFVVAGIALGFVWLPLFLIIVGIGLAGVVVALVLERAKP